MLPVLRYGHLRATPRLFDRMLSSCAAMYQYHHPLERSTVAGILLGGPKASAEIRSRTVEEMLRGAYTVKMVLGVWASHGNFASTGGGSHLAMADRLVGLLGASSQAWDFLDADQTWAVTEWLKVLTARLSTPNDACITPPTAVRLCNVLAPLALSSSNSATASDQRPSGIVRSAVQAGISRLCGQINTLPALATAQLGRLIVETWSLRAAPSGARTAVRKRLIQLLPEMSPYEAKQAMHTLSLMQAHSTESMLACARALLRAAGADGSGRGPQQSHSKRSLGVTRPSGSTQRPYIGAWSLLAQTQTFFEYLRDPKAFRDAGLRDDVAGDSNRLGPSKPTHVSTAPRQKLVMSDEESGAASSDSDADGFYSSGDESDGRLASTERSAMIGPQHPPPRVEVRAALRATCFQLLSTVLQRVEKDVAQHSRAWQQASNGDASARHAPDAQSSLSIAQLTSLLRVSREALSMAGLWAPPYATALAAVSMRSRVMKGLAARLAVSSSSSTSLESPQLGGDSHASRTNSNGVSGVDAGVDLSELGLSEYASPLSLHSHDQLTPSDMCSIAVSALAVNWSTPTLYRRLAAVFEGSQAIQQGFSFGQLADFALILGAQGVHCERLYLELDSRLQIASSGRADVDSRAFAIRIRHDAKPSRRDASQAAGESLYKAMQALALGSHAAVPSSGPCASLLRQHGSRAAVIDLVGAHMANQASRRTASRASRYEKALKALAEALPRASAAAGIATPDVHLQVPASVGAPEGCNAVDACAVPACALVPDLGLAFRLLRDRDVVLVPSEPETAASRLWVRTFHRSPAPPADAGISAVPDGDEEGDCDDARGSGRAPDSDCDDGYREERVSVLVATQQHSDVPMIEWAAPPDPTLQSGGAGCDSQQSLSPPVGEGRQFMATENPWAHAEMRLLSLAGWEVVPLGVPEWLALPAHQRVAMLAPILARAATR